MSSISKAPSHNMLSFESSDESSWTKYFEDLFNNDHNNNIDDYNDQKYSVNSFSAFDDAFSSLVSDDAANPLPYGKNLAENSQGGVEYIKRLSFKKRKKIITSLVDDDLEDTASSPINSPKIFKAKEKEDIHFYQEKGHTLGEKDERKEVGFSISDHTELNKKGLCLVPMSMVMNYLVFIFPGKYHFLAAMTTTSRLKSVDFYRKIPRDLTEASLSGAGLSIVAALAMVFLFGMELNEYLSVTTSTSVIVDKSSDGDFLRIDFNFSFPALSCEFASVDVSDVLGTNRLNLTKTVRKFSIDSNLRPTGYEFHSGPSTNVIKHDDKVDEESLEGAFVFTSDNFDKYAHQFPITAINFYAPWCYWSQRLRPSWEKAAKIIRERYDPEMDGRIFLGKVDCTQEGDLCRRHHIQGYPSIRIFRKGTDIRSDHGHHEHESYYGDRDTDSLVKTMENLVASLPSESQKLALEDKLNVTENAKRAAPSAGGCRIEGYVRVKKVPGNLIVSARSDAHSFDASQMNMSHAVHHLSFGRKLTPRAMSDLKRLIPYIGNSHDRLNGLSFINAHDLGANITVS
ncbi:protein disulfide-isomerase 5-4 [Trifolium repens]|nr:protein disulfide-isomerase 5-4 [Trifolium repens]